MFRGPLVIFEPGEDGRDRALDICPRLFGLDVGALPELILELVGHFVDLLLGRDVERDQLCPVTLLELKLFKRLFEFVALARIIHLCYFGHCWIFNLSQSYNLFTRGCHKFAPIAE